MASNFFTPSATRDLDEAQGRVDAAISGVGGKSVFASAPEEPRALDQNTLKAFEDAAIKYNVPANVLMAMAEKDSGFDPLARNRGPGPKLRGIIKMSDEDVRRDGINPYMPEQAIDSAAKKLRGLMDGSNLSIQDAVKAYASGPDPSQWGPQAADYASDVLSRTDRLKNAYYPPEPPPAPAPAPATAPSAKNSAIGDLAREAGGAAAIGVGDVLGGAAAASREIRHDLDLPEYRSMADALAEKWRAAGARVKSGVSEEAKKAVEDSSPGGDFFKPSTWTLGKNPSLFGYTMLGADIFGGMLPILASAAATGGTGALAIGGLQGGGSASEHARETINRMAQTPADPNTPDGPKQIEVQSAYYRELIAEGKTRAQALNITRSAASRYAFLFSAPVSAIGGAIVGKALRPAAEKAGQGVAARLAQSVGVPAAEMGVQNPAASVATKVGVNIGAGTNEDVTEGTFGDFITGVVSGAIPGGVGMARGERARRSQTPAPQPIAEPPRDPSAMALQAQPQGNAGASPTVSHPGDGGTPAGPAPSKVPAAPAAPANAGPLSRAIQAGAPEHAALANIVGKRVVLTDKAGQMAGHVVGQDADGVMFKGDDGAEQLVTHEELQSGETHIAEAPNAPAQETPRPAPPAETGPLPEHVAEAIKEEPKKVEPETPKAQEPAEPTVGEGFLAKKKIELGQPKIEEPAKSAESSLAEEAQARAKFAPKPPERPLSDMSEPELRERMKFIAGQAKTNGGWNKMLSTARREVESEIDARNTAAKPEPAKVEEPAKPESAPEPEPVKAEEFAPAPKAEAPIDKKRAAALDRIANKRAWFGKREGAESFIEKNDLADTHEVKQTGKSRFDVVEKAKPTEGFEKFPAESGTLGIPRDDMPQIPTESHGGLVRHLNAKGIEHRIRIIDASELKPTQAEFSPEKVEQAKEATGDRAVIVANDGHIIDGHHQALAAKEKGEEVKAIVLDAPVKEALEAVRNSPSATTPAEVAAKAEAAPEAGKESVKEPGKASPSDYGAKNKLVTRERADAPAARLKQKFKEAGAQFNSGIDPEFLSIGVELAAFHIEAGAHKFADFAHAVSEQLGISLANLKPYLRSWYNGARDMMEDAGHDVSAHDSPEVVRSELARILKEEGDESRSMEEPGKGSLEGVPADKVQGTGQEREAAGGAERGGGADLQRNESASRRGNEQSGRLGNGEGEVSVPARRSAPESEARPRASRERGGEDVQRTDARDEPGSPRTVKDPAAGRPAAETGADFAITDADHVGEGGAKTKFKQNLEAIRVLKRLDETGERATAADQAVLAKYVGWGGLPQAFERSDKTFSKGGRRKAPRCASF